jgi:hypothetical protein
LTQATTTPSGVCAAGQVCYAVSSWLAGAIRTDASKVVNSVASRVSAVDLVSSASGCALASSLSGGWNTVAIVKVTTDANGNTISTGDNVKTVMNSINVNFTKNATTTLTHWRIHKCGGVDGYAGTTASDSADALLTLGYLPNDNQIAAQTTVYYGVDAYVSAMQNGTGNDWIEVDLNTLNGTVGNYTRNFAWQDSSEATPMYKLLLSISQIQGTKIVEP